MTLYLFRHAEKSSPFHADPALSELGLRQAVALAQKVQRGDLPRPTQMWVSPRLRTHQSFQPLADLCGLKLQVVPELDEKLSGENRHQFRERLEIFFQKVAKVEGVLFLCSHYDWLEESLNILPCERDLRDAIESQWSPLQYIALELKNDQYEYLDCQRILP